MYTLANGDIDNSMLLGIAVAGGNAVSVSLILNMYPDLDVTVALLHAIRRGNTEIIQILAQHVQQLNYQTRFYMLWDIFVHKCNQIQEDADQLVIPEQLIS